MALRRRFFQEEGNAEIDGVEAARVFVDAVAEHAADGFSVIMAGGAMTTRYEGSEGMLADGRISSSRSSRSG
jgi:hypothetical protein